MKGEFIVGDRYLIQHELGRGGMATVYRATDTRYNRDVAVKILHAVFVEGVAANRFLREIEVASRLSHPHIVPLLDSGSNKELLWLVMPVLEGQSLREKLEREKQLKLSDAVRITLEIASALSYAHAQGVVHRDIKPENILLSGETIAVADFGLAKGLAESGSPKLTKTGVAIGTPFYMSPEQAAGEKVDHRADIYSLGCMLYEMLTGEPPYVGNSFRAVVTKAFSDPIPSARRFRESVSMDLDAAIAKALAKTPADRFATADEFAAALAGVNVSGASQPAIAPVSMPTAPAISPPPPPLPSSSAEIPPPRRKWLPLAIVALMLVVGPLLVLTALRNRSTTHTPRSIAVIPFANLSDDKSQEYFSAGMTDELLGALATVPQLRVAGRASSYAVRDKSADIAQIGKRLNVEAVLEGTVRRSGDEVRVSAELVSVADGFRIWRSTYDRRVTDVFALQEEIARAIVAAIRLELGDKKAMVARATQNMDAYESYLRGRHALDTRTAAAISTAETEFRRAVDADPLYARAWSGLADVYIFQGLNYYAPPAGAYAKAKAAAERALSLDSTLAEAHTSLATVHYLYDRDYDAAAASYNHAIALDPKYPQAHYFNAIFLSGRDPAAAEREAKLAAELDPLSPPMAQALGMVRVSLERYADAVQPLRAAVALEPNYYFSHAWLSLALAHAGTPAEAVAEAKRALDLNPSNNLVRAYLGEVYATIGDRAAALDVAHTLDTLSATQPVCGVYVARIYDRLGDTENAFRWLARAMDAHEGQLSQITWPNAFPNARKDPRFQQLTKQLGLAGK